MRDGRSMGRQLDQRRQFIRSGTKDNIVQYKSSFMIKTFPAVCSCAHFRLLVVVSDDRFVFVISEFPPNGSLSLIKRPFSSPKKRGV